MRKCWVVQFQQKIEFTITCCKRKVSLKGEKNISNFQVGINPQPLQANEIKKYRLA